MGQQFEGIEVQNMDEENSKISFEVQNWTSERFPKTKMTLNHILDLFKLLSHSLKLDLNAHIWRSHRILNRPQCPFLAVPPHIKWTSMSISGGPTAYYWTSMPPRTWDPGNTGSQAILRTSHPGCHSIKPVNWTAILAVIQSNQ